MNTNPKRFTKAAIGATAVFAALLFASCASTIRSPEQVAASNPTVTYKYRNDDELVQANQQAITFCSQYQSSLPRTQSFANDSDGKKIVVFECVGATAFANVPPRQPNSDLTYNFQTDQELLDVSRDAQIYCLNNGSPEMDSNIVIRSNGSKTVTFRCSQG
ncbi:MAG TPA: hypothetical protein VI566_01915 [Xanthomonadales bacterium]|nr:hypothetical protein [Xanthomonadales bacterium]